MLKELQDKRLNRSLSWKKDGNVGDDMADTVTILTDVHRLNKEQLFLVLPN